jgi:hypothetical protein
VTIVASIPEDARVALWLKTRNCVLDRSEDDSRKVLRRYPSLLRQYLKYRGMSRTTGRLIVIDQRRVSRILAWLGK